MAREQLYLGGQYIPLSKSINASITKSIADIAEPNKRKATYSKTTTIPNSKEAQAVFTAIYELNLVEYTNSSLQDITFDPTIKIDCLYLVDGEQVINGYCQLKKITQTDTYELVFSIVMFGSIASIFREWGEDYLDSDDMIALLDRWNHPFNKDIQADSWATQVWDNDASAFIPFALGTGYVYPLMDFGLTTNLTDFDFDKIPMSLYAREYMLAMFTHAGFTWTSTFLDSTYFKSLIIPSSPTNFQLDSTEILDREFVSNTPQFVNTASTTSANLQKGSYGSLGLLKFTNEVSDAGNNYDPATGVFTTVNGGVYNFNALIDVNATFTPDSGGNVVTTSDIEGRIEMFVNGGIVQSLPFYITYDDYPTGFSIGARSTDTTPTITSNNTTPEYITGAGSFSSVTNPASAINQARQVSPPDRYLCSFQNIALNAGDTLDIRIKARYRGLNNVDNQMFYSGTVYSGGNAAINITVGSFYNNLVNTYPAYNSTLKISKCIPKKIKQREYFMSIVKMFNLWVDVDPNNQQNLIIETRDDFLSTDIIDIQTKWSQDKPTDEIPMGKLDAVDFLFTYKEDKDHFNAKYTSQWDELYGERIIRTTNDFVRGSKKTQVIFSPTTMVAPPLSNRVIPTIIEVDDLGQPKETDYNIRILFYGGLKDTFTTWNHIHYPIFNVPSPTVYSQYPYAGHFDDPFNATEDINFGLVKEVYYDDDIDPITVTNNNLVNKYHLNMLNAYTDKDSMIVTAFFNMTSTDFRTWDFSKLYRFNNAYFRLNKIMNYNPTSDKLTKCEFLFLANVELFSPRYPLVDGAEDEIASGPPGGGLDDTEDNPLKGTNNNSQPDGGNHTGRGVEDQGDNNYVASDSYFIKIQGDNNKVFSESEFIDIQGSNNEIGGGLKNVTLIDSSDLIIEESNVTYIGGVKVNPDTVGLPTAVEAVSASQDVETTVSTYEVDTSGGDVTMTFDLATIIYTEGQKWYFKKESGANRLIIVATGGTIDDSTNATLMGLKDGISLQYDGGSNFIIGM